MSAPPQSVQDIVGALMGVGNDEAVAALHALLRLPVQQGDEVREHGGIDALVKCLYRPVRDTQRCAAEALSRFTRGNDANCAALCSNNGYGLQALDMCVANPLVHPSSLPALLTAVAQVLCNVAKRSALRAQVCKAGALRMLATLLTSPFDAVLDAVAEAVSHLARAGACRIALRGCIPSLVALMQGMGTDVSVHVLRAVCRLALNTVNASAVCAAGGAHALVLHLACDGNECRMVALTTLERIARHVDGGKRAVRDALGAAADVSVDTVFNMVRSGHAGLARRLLHTLNIEAEPRYPHLRSRSQLLGRHLKRPRPEDAVLRSYASPSGPADTLPTAHMTPDEARRAIVDAALTRPSAAAAAVAAAAAAAADAAAAPPRPLSRRRSPRLRSRRTPSGQGASPHSSSQGASSSRWTILNSSGQGRSSGHGHSSGQGPFPHSLGQGPPPLASLPLLSSVSQAHAAPIPGTPPHVSVDMLDTSTIVGTGVRSRVFRGTLRDSPVAVKVFTGLLRDTAQVNAFTNEVHALMQLKHHGLLVCHGTPARVGLPMVVTQLMDASLEHVLQREATALPLQCRLSLMTQVGNALAYLHARRCVHGDVRPTCVLLTADRRMAKLSVCTAERLLDRTGVTPAAPVSFVAGVRTVYMAPELAARGGAGVTTSMDVYAFAMCMWRVFTGQQPYEGMTTLVELVMHVCINHGRPAVSALPGSLVRDGLGRLLTQMWHLDATARPSMADVCTQVQQVHAMAGARAVTAAEGDGAGTMPTAMECTVCFEPIPQRMALVPCGHTTVCGQCIQGGGGPALDKCPVCRTSVQSSVTVYM